MPFLDDNIILDHEAAPSGGKTYGGRAPPLGQVFVGWSDNGAGGRAPMFGKPEENQDYLSKNKDDPYDRAPATAGDSAQDHPLTVDVTGPTHTDPKGGTFLPDDIKLDEPPPNVGAGLIDNDPLLNGAPAAPGPEPDKATGLAGKAWRDTVGENWGIDASNEETARKWSGPGGMLYPLVDAGAKITEGIGGGVNAAIAGATQLVGNTIGANPHSTEDAARGLVDMSNIGQLYAGGHSLTPGYAPKTTVAAKIAPYVVADDMGSIAKRLGIKPAPATVGGRFAAGAQVGLSNAPGSAGPVRAVIEGETEGLAAAARKTAGQMGNVSTPQGAGESQAKGAKAWERLASLKAGKVFDRRDELLGGKTAPIVMGNTGKALADFSAASPASPVLTQLLEHPKLRRLREGLAGQEELTVGDVTGPNGLLSHVRTVARNAHKSSTITGATEFQLNKLKNAILADVNNAAEASDAIAGRSGSGSAKAAQREGDALWRDRATAKEREMKLPLASAEDPINVSGEKVYRQMFKDMMEEGGNIVRLRSTLARMPTNQRRTFSATAFDDLGKAKPNAQNAAGDAWSYETFGTNWGAMSEDARKLVFGGKGVDQQISDIVKYTERLKQLNKDYNFSRTAPALLRGGSAVAAVTSLVTGTVVGGIGSGIEAAAIVGGIHGSLNVIGRAFVSNPAMRIWTKNALSATVKGNEGQLRTLIRRLPALAKSHPEARADIVKFQTALNSALASRGMNAAEAANLGLNDNISAAAVASPDPEENQQQQ